jgi:DNA-binding CsgD family transcriptional regulator
MIGIPEANYKTILEFMDSLTLSSVNFREQVLLSFQKFFGYHQANFWECDENHKLINPVQLNMDNYITKDYLQNYYHLDLLIPQNVNFEKCLVIRNLDIVPAHIYENSEYYHDFMKKYGFYYNLAMFLFDGKRLLGMVDFVKPKKDIPFSLNEVKTLEIISRFLIQKLHALEIHNKNKEIGSKSNSYAISSPKIHQQILTQKENEVLELAKKGYSNSQIANELFISVNTVKKHMQSLYQKFNVSNRTSLCYKAHSSDSIYL